MKNSGESKNYLKQVAQSLDQISNNMPDKSYDEILQQMYDKMAEVLKAIESSKHNDGMLHACKKPCRRTAADACKTV